MLSHLIFNGWANQWEIILLQSGYCFSLWTVGIPLLREPSGTLRRKLDGEVSYTAGVMIMFPRSFHKHRICDKFWWAGEVVKQYYPPFVTDHTFQFICDTDRKMYHGLRTSSRPMGGGSPMARPRRRSHLRIQSNRNGPWEDRHALGSPRLDESLRQLGQCP